LQQENEVKLKHVPYLLGRKPVPQTYGYKKLSFELPKEGKIEYAQWLHPRSYHKGVLQEDVDALKSFLRPGDVAIDIGAHAGDFTVPIALAVVATGCVLAFEPNSYVFPVLEANASLNPEKTHIVPMMYAATPKDGEIEFEYSDSGFCNGGRHEGVSKWLHGHVFRLTVQGRNLEALLREKFPELLPRLRYLKVDAEGYDLTVLRSLEKLILQFKPYINAEVFKWNKREPRLELFRYLAGLGYKIHRVADDTNYRGELLTEADVMRWRHYDIFCIPGSATASA
jgi:FkbM family methyltransferase